MEFTKEQLISRIGVLMARRKESLSMKLFVEEFGADVEILKIALAVLTAPDYIPHNVLDAMSDMCDGGFHAQGIWDLCRESIMPPAPCARCGTVSDRPDGVHYCHISIK
ncbi:hypothetical protein [Enterobacter hormaechei]|uniref:hypothetical protein n=1 Tax=Enterobacter hormaechei TaxID=158836 RepID=UPI000E2F9D68|nr:hypothetical protein [Enterobacter hormaechei]